MAKIDTKSLLKSKTFYFGLLWILVAVANWFGYGDYQPDAKLNEILEFVNGIAIIFLRIKTDKAVKL